MLLTLLCMPCCAFKFVGTIDSWHGVHASTRLVHHLSSGMFSLLAVLRAASIAQGWQPADTVMSSFALAGSWRVVHQALCDTADARQKPGRQVSIRLAMQSFSPHAFYAA